MTEKTDDELAAAAREGDRAALELLLGRYQPKIYRFGLKMCGHTEDAEDLLQETMLAAARTIRKFRGDASVSTWLYAIARSFCIKARRKSKFAPTEEEALSEGIESPDKGPEASAYGREIGEVLEEGIRLLDPDHREVLVLRDVEGLSAKEVAGVVRISVGAVKSRLHRARVRLRDTVALLLEEGEEEARGRDDCPDILGLYSRYLEDEIAPEVCREMEHHIEECPHCRDRCDLFKETLAMCRAAPAEVPEPVQRSVRASMRRALQTSDE